MGGRDPAGVRRSSGASLPLDDALRRAVQRRAPISPATVAEPSDQATAPAAGDGAMIVERRPSVREHPLLQRFPVDKLPEAAGTTDDEPQERTTLILLAWELVKERLPDAEDDKQRMALLTTINVLLATGQRVPRDDINELVGHAAELLPKRDDGPRRAAPATRRPGPRPLKGKEGKLFKAAVELAQERLARTATDDDALSAAFSRGERAPATLERAKRVFERIAKHLKHWQSHSSSGFFGASSVLVFHDEAAVSYAAANRGSGETSQVILGSSAFDAQFKTRLADTLVHEASHGIGATVDHCYRDAPFFARVEDDIALTNATHYEYAIALAHDEDSAQRDDLSDGMLRVVEAIDLAWYLANKIQTFLMWTQQHYLERRPDWSPVTAHHGALLSFDEGSSMKLRLQHLEVLVGFYRTAKSFLGSRDPGLEARQDDDGSLVLSRPGGRVQLRLSESALSESSTEAIAEQILASLATRLGMTDIDVMTFGRWLFANLFVEHRHGDVKPTEEERQLYELLRAGRLGSRHRDALRTHGGEQRPERDRTGKRPEKAARRAPRRAKGPKRDRPEKKGGT